MQIVPSALDVLNAMAQTEAVRVTRGLRYGIHGRSQLDVYRPSKAKAPAPVIVFFYGGSWEEGDRPDYFFVGAALAARGFTTVIADYRIYPEVLFPAFIEDGAEVVAWTKENIAKMGGDSDRILVMGHSAGAHLAAMLTFDKQWLGRFDLDAKRDLRGFIGLAGPYDFLPLRRETLKIIFGPEDSLAATQPINFVTSDAPPSFLATGRDDTIVDPANSMRLSKRIRAAGGVAHLKLYDRLSHRTIIGAFSPALRFLGPVLRDVIAFAERETAAVAERVPEDAPR